MLTEDSFKGLKETQLWLKFLWEASLVWDFFLFSNEKKYDRLLFIYEGSYSECTSSCSPSGLLLRTESPFIHLLLLDWFNQLSGWRCGVLAVLIFLLVFNLGLVGLKPWYFPFLSDVWLYSLTVTNANRALIRWPKWKPVVLCVQMNHCHNLNHVLQSKSDFRHIVTPK